MWIRQSPDQKTVAIRVFLPAAEHFHWSAEERVDEKNTTPIRCVAFCFFRRTLLGNAGQRRRSLIRYRERDTAADSHVFRLERRLISPSYGSRRWNRSNQPVQLNYSVVHLLTRVFWRLYTQDTIKQQRDRMTAKRVTARKPFQQANLPWKKLPSSWGQTYLAFRRSINMTL